MGLLLPPFTATVPYLSNLYIPIIFVIWSSYVDVYMSLFVAFYNNDGIFITHPKYTAKNYLTHNFVMDLISTLPIQLLVKWIDVNHNEDHDPIMHLVYPHFTHCSWMFLLTLQLYKMVGLVRYLESNIALNSDIVRSLKLFMPIIIIMNIISSLVFNVECDYRFYKSRKRGK